MLQICPGVLIIKHEENNVFDMGNIGLQKEVLINYDSLSV